MTKIIGRTYTAHQGWVEYSHTLSDGAAAKLQSLAKEIAETEARAAWVARSDGKRNAIGRLPAVEVTSTHMLAAARSLYEVQADRLAIGTRQIERLA